MVAGHTTHDVSRREWAGQPARFPEPHGALRGPCVQLRGAAEVRGRAFQRAPGLFALQRRRLARQLRALQVRPHGLDRDTVPEDDSSMGRRCFQTAPLSHSLYVAACCFLSHDAETSSVRSRELKGCDGIILSTQELLGGARGWDRVLEMDTGHLLRTHGDSPHSCVRRYDLARFSPVNAVAFDHPDPSIFTVLTVPSAQPGAPIRTVILCNTC